MGRIHVALLGRHYCNEACRVSWFVGFGGGSPRLYTYVVLLAVRNPRGPLQTRWLFSRHRWSRPPSQLAATAVHETENLQTIVACASICERAGHRETKSCVLQRKHVHVSDGTGTTGAHGDVPRHSRVIQRYGRGGLWFELFGMLTIKCTIAFVRSPTVG